MSRGPSIWSELKRRKVVRVAVVYAATAFAVLQAADTRNTRDFEKCGIALASPWRSE